MVFLYPGDHICFGQYTPSRRKSFQVKPKPQINLKPEDLRKLWQGPRHMNSHASKMSKATP